MSFQLKEIVPWGRSFQEYVAMFALSEEDLDLRFHIDTITELCRVCGETRLFPLLQLGAVPSPHVEPVIEHFRAQGYDVTCVQVPYEFQRGGNQMLKIRRNKKCRNEN